MSAVSADQRAILGQYPNDLRVLVSVITCDTELETRVRRFQAQADAMPDGVPALSLIDPVVTRGRCYSCAERIPGAGRCWRCEVAARLVLGLPLLCSDTPRTENDVRAWTRPRAHVIF